ncbi:MAG TPA: replication-associated recombination protein A [Thermodesulfobacteriota bacterium]|nr:replication-associated recombination protein A [Thermodesulfobacteriota bacterium]
MKKQKDLFERKGKELFKREAPLADRMRPQTLDEFVGQDHLLGHGKILRQAIESDHLPSMILWGPPGSGKTTLAMIVATTTGAQFLAFSAVLSGVKEIKEVIKEAEEEWTYNKRRTILFVDEIHRFNKAQQDAFLPHVEKGTIILIGATTENPSFEVISPLLSRTKVFTLQALKEEEVELILKRGLVDKERGLGQYATVIEPEVFEGICRIANGDARIALNTLEMSVLTAPPDQKGTRHIKKEDLEEVLQRKAFLYDKSGEEHYNLISAFHKSLRGSDPDAALYWLGRMLEAGEDPLYIARRMVRFASEDVGIADSQALQVAVTAMEAFHFIGLPEGDLALAQAAVYLATAPKSNALYTGYLRVKKDVRELENMPVPLHIRNAPTKLMEDLGYGKDYKYPHDYPDHFVEEEYLPENLKGRTYYHPTEQGFEKEIKKRLEYWRRKRSEKEK